MPVLDLGDRTQPNIAPVLQIARTSGLPDDSTASMFAKLSKREGG
jgi:hypothetical protein